MLQLERITTLYSQDQDRLSLNALDKEGGTVRIWLTQRLVLRLIPELVKLVKPKHDDPVYASVLAEVAQQRAVERHEPQAPVRVDGPGQEWLVGKIDMQMAAAGVILTFSSAEGQTARLAMDAELLRQWLAILKRVCDSAEWKCDWPEWMSQITEKKVAARVLH